MARMGRSKPQLQHHQAVFRSLNPNKTILNRKKRWPIFLTNLHKANYPYLSEVRTGRFKSTSKKLPRRRQRPKRISRKCRQPTRATTSSSSIRKVPRTRRTSTCLLSMNRSRKPTSIGLN